MTPTRTALELSRLDLNRTHTGRNEAISDPEGAVVTDQHVAIWAESKRHAWACNTMLLTTIVNRLRNPEPSRVDHDFSPKAVENARGFSTMHFRRPDGQCTCGQQYGRSCRQHRTNAFNDLHSARQTTSTPWAA